MTSTNDITKARLTTGAVSKAYRDNYDRIFRRENAVDLYMDQPSELVAFLGDVNHEVTRAKEKFPGTQHVIVALMEEVGELAQALLQINYEDKSSGHAVYKEAVQVAAMAARVAVEGDPTLPEYKGFADRFDNRTEGYDD